VSYLIQMNKNTKKPQLCSQKLKHIVSKLRPFIKPSWRTLLLRDITCSRFLNLRYNSHPGTPQFVRLFQKEITDLLDGFICCNCVLQKEPWTWRMGCYDSEDIFQFPSTAIHIMHMWTHQTQSVIYRLPLELVHMICDFV